MTLISLAICAVVAQAAPADPTADPVLETTTVEIGKAPRVRPMPAGLPNPRRSPTEGSWHDDELGEMRGGTYLPQPLDSWVNRRLRLLESYPELCQRHLDAQARVHQVEVEGNAAILEAKCIAQRIDQSLAEDTSQAWPPWVTVAVALGATLIGGLAGYGLRAVVR